MVHINHSIPSNVVEMNHGFLANTHYLCQCNAEAHAGLLKSQFRLF